jgi:hypothetical protein
LTPGSTPYVDDEAKLVKFYGWLEEYFAFFASDIGGVFMTPRGFRESVDRERLETARRPEARVAAE